MKIVCGIIFIILLTLIGSRKTFTRIKIFITEHHFFLTGTEFIIIGYILGKGGFELIDSNIIEGLYPFLGLGLGWIGLIYGLQFNLHRLIRFPIMYFVSSIIQSIITIIVVVIGTYYILNMLFVGITPLLAPVLILAASASCSSSTIPAMLAMEKKHARKKSLRIIRFISGSGDVIGILLVGIAFSLFQGTKIINIPVHPVFHWLFFSLILGTAIGMLFNFLTSANPTKNEILLVTIGLVLFGGGLALYLKISPIFVNFVAGVIISNFNRNWHKIENLTVISEKTIYLILLILAGALWNISGKYFVLLSIAYFIIRASGKLFSGFIIAKVLLKKEKIPGSLGFGLTCQSGMAATMIINFQLFAVSGFDNLIVSMVLISIIIGDLLCPYLSTWLLNREGK